MDHNHDVSARGKSLAVAGLLIAAISVIGVVDEGLHTQLPGERGGLVLAGIVDENLDVHNIGQFPHCLFQGLFGVVGRHHDRNPLSVDHGFNS